MRSFITSGSVLNRNFTPDSLGNIQTITDNLDAARSQSFTYDNLQQLTNATGIYGTIAFTYDKTGNRQTRTADGVTDATTYVTGTNQPDTITGSAEIKFDHDLIGRTFTTGPAPSSTPPPDYTYTHDGQRLVKTIDTQTTVYHYDITGQLIAETDATGALIKAYVWLNSQPLAQITPDGSVYYYHNDHLGTPQRLTDASGAIVWAADYLPFGKADVTITTIENNLRFSGQYYDQETGLHYNYWRFYDPELGRYLRADPIGLDGGINLYAYVSNNPANYYDPYGLKLVGYVVRLLDNGGKVIVRKLRSKRAAVKARKRNENVQAISRQRAHDIENAHSGGNGLKKHDGHILKDSNRNVIYDANGRPKRGGPHYQTEGKPGHTFWGGIVAFLGSLMNPFDAISGELGNPQIDSEGDGIPDGTNKALLEMPDEYSECP